MIINVDVKYSKERWHGDTMEWIRPFMKDFKRVGKAFSPVWTGALKSSIRVEEKKDSRGKPVQFSVIAGSEDIINPITGTPTARYAAYQESLRGYMETGYRRTKKRIQTAAEDLFK